MKKAFVVAPVFKELEYVKDYIRQWEMIDSLEVNIFIVNANYGDETTEFLKSRIFKISVTEIEAEQDCYWSCLVKSGLSKIHVLAVDDDIVIINNIDIQFSNDTVRELLNVFKNERVLASVTLNHNVGISSGVIVINWFFSINRHVYRGVPTHKIKKDQMIQVDMLPTRFICFSKNVLDSVGYPDTEELPHYGADYEYTNRMRLKGYQLFVISNSFVCIDIDNTGNHADGTGSFIRKLKNINSMKSSYNLKYRFRYVRLVYPVKYIIPGYIMNFVKIFLSLITGS